MQSGPCFPLARLFAWIAMFRTMLHGASIVVASIGNAVGTGGGMFVVFANCRLEACGLSFGDIIEQMRHRSCVQIGPKQTKKMKP